MTKIVLLHGTLQGVQAFSRPAPLTTQYGGFYGWKEQLDAGIAIYFPWGRIRHLKGFAQFSPRSYLNVYMQEKKLISQEQALQKLNDFLLLNKPEVVICHSRGTDYFLHYVNSYPLIKSIKKIVFVGGGVERDLRITNSDAIQKIKDHQLEWINYFCPWDNVLFFTSFFLNRKIASGLFGTSNHYIKNKFVFLPINFNPHMKVINDLLFIKQILGKN